MFVARLPAARVWIALVLAALLVGAGLPAPTFAKDFPLIVVVDCGVRSGQKCPDGSTIVGVRTDQVSGRPATYKVDFAWVMKQEPTLRQDQELCIEVRDNARDDNVLQAISILDNCSGPAPRVKSGKGGKDDDQANSDTVGTTGDPDPEPLLCGTAINGTGTRSWVQEEFVSNGNPFLVYDVISGSARFEVFYEGNSVKAIGPFVPADLDGLPFGIGVTQAPYGPGTSTLVTVVVTAAPGAQWFVQLSCGLTA